MRLSTWSPRLSAARSTRSLDRPQGMRLRVLGLGPIWMALSAWVGAAPAAGGSSTSPNCIWVADILVPDLAGWRRERLPEYPDAAFFDLAPDWVCEVLSPGTRRIDQVGKRVIYAREGVGHLWVR